MGSESSEGSTTPRSSIFLVAFVNLSPWLSKLASVADWSKLFVTTNLLDPEHYTKICCSPTFSVPGLDVYHNS